MFKDALKKSVVTVANIGAGLTFAGMIFSSPIGAIAGGITHGLLGAGIGWLAGPFAGLALLGAYFPVIMLRDKLDGDQPPSKPKMPWTAHRIKFEIGERCRGLVRGAGFIGSFYIATVTLGRFQPELDLYPPQRFYQPPPSPAAAAPAPAKSSGLGKLKLSGFFNRGAKSSPPPAKPQPPSAPAP